MNKKNIITDILSIIKKLNTSITKIDINEVEELYFFGKEIGLQPRELIYLLDEVSIRYNKKISSDDINTYNFKKVGDLVEFIMET